jgi:uncharacterized protein YlxW (UPF0749 family)
VTNIETVVWALSGTLTLLTILFGTIWKMVRDESKSQGAAIERKADLSRVIESEKAWKEEMREMQHDNEKLMSKLEFRYERDIAQLESRLSTEIKTLEHNIITQMKLMLEVIQRKD